MEAWKWLNYSAESPIYALSLTTNRWGLEPFPGNLVAVREKSIEAQRTTNLSLDVTLYTLPYTCQGYRHSTDSIADSIQNNNRRKQVQYPSVLTNTSELSNTQFCGSPCASSGCLILVEGIARTRTGPQNTNIIALAHGLSFFFSTLLTSVVIMGFFSLKKRSKVPKVTPPPGYTAPAQPSKRGYAEDLAAQVRSSKEIIACADMFREMYALDLAIWGQEGSVDISEQQKDMERANALYVEICRIVQKWQIEDDRWTLDERKRINEIIQFLNQHDRQPYVL